ncbi:sugar efflux transporter [Catenovulum adriaticum]|uniref:Sugar efflux transporter n=1 Tax=Catenovulum adriaticum TaxID=2984846 RepID=A0ABY7ALE7_9ALTE|nr:sugar efflux transporter [Catenovulum sp. TS8]WAJ70364.1 sugar efflux transporter [Catenovulum sp. TS8]
MLSGLKQQGLLFLTLSMLTGLIGSFVHPLMSLFIVEGLNSPPAYIGIYTVSVTLAGLVFSQWLGALADKGVSARKMFMIAITGMGVALLIFANSTSFWTVLIAGVLLFSMGNAAIPQVLTLGRQWAGRQPNINVTQFNSGLRAAISFAWIGGPPLGYALASGAEFSRSLYVAAFCALVALLFAFRFIPEVPSHAQKTTEHSKQAIPFSFWILGAAVMLGSAANIMYFSALPLYTIKELGFAKHMPGIFMGLVACLEIPIMLLAGKLAQKHNKINMIIFSFFCAMLFYTGIYFAEQVWHFIALQFINALFYGVFAGIGLTILQEELPLKIGFTSAFYSNAVKIGMMLGTSSTGLIAQFYSFRVASIGSFCAVALALTCLLLFSYLKRKAVESTECEQSFTITESKASA